MRDRIYILGGYQTDFARNFAREGKDIAGLMEDTLRGGLESTGLAASFIETVHIGNFIGELTARQAHLGGFVSEVIPEFDGIPCSRHEAACASGGIAVLAAMSDILSGRYSTAAVAGLELERNIPGDEVATHLGTAAWYDRECVDVRYPWPQLFSDIGDLYEARYGLDRSHLTAISQTHFANARSNPNAQTRQWVMDEGKFSDDPALNPVVTGRIRRSDCSQVTDGGAMVVLASSEAAAAFAARRGEALEDLPYIKGWGHTTAPIQLTTKLERTRDQAYLFPHLRKCIADAHDRAGLASVFDLDALETHDCFTTSAYMAIDHFGITPPGENVRAVDEGWLRKDGRLPMNPGGGLIGGGHPVGATGVRMVLDGYKQTTGRAGDYQVEGCRNIGTLNIGGSVTTCVSFVIGRDIQQKKKIT